VPRIIVFDVNETLLNLRDMEPLFEEAFSDKTALGEWFALLLLHSEVATLAGPYFDFATIARAALQMTASARGFDLSESAADRILRAMASMPPHPEVPDALQTLLDAGLRLVTLTNSSQRVLEQQMANAGLARFFERNFSVDTVKRFKPAPEPYRMVAGELGVETRDLRMVAAHAWDIVGALQAGCAGAFVSRPGKVMFPLGPQPDIQGANLSEVARKILEYQSRNEYP